MNKVFIWAMVCMIALSNVAVSKERQKSGFLVNCFLEQKCEMVYSAVEKYGVKDWEAFWIKVFELSDDKFCEFVQDWPWNNAVEHGYVNALKTKLNQLSVKPRLKLMRKLLPVEGMDLENLLKSNLLLKTPIYQMKTVKALDLLSFLEKKAFEIAKYLEVEHDKDLVVKDISQSRDVELYIFSPTLYSNFRMLVAYNHGFFRELIHLNQRSLGSSCNPSVYEDIEEDRSERKKFTASLLATKEFFSRIITDKVYIQRGVKRKLDYTWQYDIHIYKDLHPVYTVTEMKKNNSIKTDLYIYRTSMAGLMTDDYEGTLSERAWVIPAIESQGLTNAWRELKIKAGASLKERANIDPYNAEE